jgi:hypothetical protein
VNDNGQRTLFETGALRQPPDPSKCRPDLISPLAQWRLGNWLRDGAAKYSERNWEKGLPQTRTLGSLKRHILAYELGETDEDHLAAILCNAMFLTHIDEGILRGIYPVGLDDRTDYRGLGKRKVVRVSEEVAVGLKEVLAAEAAEVEGATGNKGLMLGTDPYADPSERAAIATSQKERVKG